MRIVFDRTSGGLANWRLLTCSVAALALVIKQFTSFKTKRVTPPKLPGKAMRLWQTRLAPADVLLKAVITLHGNGSCAAPGTAPHHFRHPKCRACSQLAGLCCFMG